MPTPLEIVSAMTAAMAMKDYDTACRHFAPGCEYTNLPMDTVSGPEGVRAVLEPFFAPTIENEFITIRSAVQGNTVFLERLDRHRLADKWVELPVTGVFELQDGKITVWREYYDLATIMQHWPQPGA
jgi:limonene-1,2-epoxide hydrolase